MKDFLTDFYNKVINFFQSEKSEGENTKETAKNRLKLVLMQDRSNLEPETMAQLREELIEVISKYIVIDKESLGLNLDGDGESMALMLNIPVIRAKKPEEIREALEAAKAKSSEITEEKDNVKAETQNEVEELQDESEETVVEFSEGSIDELDLPPCKENGTCPCQDKENAEQENTEDAALVEESETEHDAVDAADSAKDEKDEVNSSDLLNKEENNSKPKKNNSK